MKKKNNLATMYEIDGKNLYYGFLAGSWKIIENQVLMNKINVFPVPDGDTGANLASTFKYIVNKVTPDISFKKTIDAIALAAVDGARGNSGIIFAQFLQGLSNNTKNERNIDVKKFARMVKNSIRYAYESIEKPVEGTIITVIREWAEYIDSIKEKTDGFFKLISASLKVARKSLKETPEKLKVLKKHNVVDAGAQGFVFFLEGLIESLKGKSIRKFLRLKTKEIEKPLENKELLLEHLTYRYCTEAVIEGNLPDREIIRGKIKELGDSLVIAGSQIKKRIHIHTDQPAEFFQILNQLGTLPYQKADDMLRQYQAVHQRKGKIALVTDSSCDLPAEILDFYQVHMVPIHLHFGESHFLDKLTITPDQFYRLVEKSPDFPTTSQPGIADFRNLYTFLTSHYDSVIALHLSHHLSGTWQNSKKAAEEISRETGKKISVINSRHLSGSLGLIVYRVAQAAAAGETHEEIVKRLDQWIAGTFILVSVKTFESMVRGGRVSPMKGWLANVLNLKPIISVDSEGKSILYKKAFSQKGNIKKVMGIVAKKIQTHKIRYYSILHAHSPKDARNYAKKMENLLGKPPDFIVDISPVVGLNAGQGALAISAMVE